MRAHLQSTVVLSCLALCTAASAQTLVFSADNEDAGVLATDTPPGPWNNIILAAGAGKSIGVSPAAAHSGGGGLRAVDSSNLPNVAGTVAQVDVWFDGGFADRYVRFWYRPVVTAGNFDAALAVLHVTQANFVSQWALSTEPGLDLTISYWDSNTDYYSQTLPYSFTPNTWHLVEGAVIGSGSASGQVAVWVDGVERYRDAGIPEIGWYADQFLAGHCWSNDGTFLGTFDYDDVAIATGPMASTVAIDAGAGALVGGACAPVQVVLRSSLGPAAGPYRNEQLRVSVQSGAAALYTDSTCSTAGLPVIAAGSTSAVFGVRATSGPLQLLADTDNLIGTTATFAVTDGGTNRLALIVGCGCSTGGPAAIALLLVGVAVRRRKAR